MLYEFNASITFNFQTRSDQVIRYADLIREMGKLGCISINLGVESDSEEVLRRYNKQVDRVTNRKAIEVLRTSDIEAIVYIIMFEALESLEDIGKNYAFIKENELTSFELTNNLYGCMRPFYGTEYHKTYGKYYEKNIHGVAQPLFRDHRVKSLYDCIVEFRNDYEDRINYSVINAKQMYNQHKDEDIKTKN